MNTNKHESVLSSLVSIGVHSWLGLRSRPEFQQFEPRMTRISRIRGKPFTLPSARSASSAVSYSAKTDDKVAEASRDKRSNDVAEDHGNVVLIGLTGNQRRIGAVQGVELLLSNIGEPVQLEEEFLSSKDVNCADACGWSTISRQRPASCQNHDVEVGLLDGDHIQGVDG